MAIGHVHIKNYKSIKDLSFDAKKINIFIGEPNTGKSNILEAMSFFSQGTTNHETFSQLFRFTQIADLYYDLDISQSIEVDIDDYKFVFLLSGNQLQVALQNTFEATYSLKKELLIKETIKINQLDLPKFEVTFDSGTFTTLLRTYIFKRLPAFKPSLKSFLSSPYGDNIPTVLLSNKEIRKQVSDIFKEKGYRLELKLADHQISMIKENADGDLFSYPYQSVSETLQRIIFMILAIDSNENMSLVFDEPESNTFPFYTKYIAERIALDKSNQYFITTHNPYLLMNIIEKAKADDLNIFVTRMKDYQTKLFPLDKKKFSEALDLGSDVFFELDSLITNE